VITAGRRLLGRGAVPRGDDEGRARGDLVSLLILLRRPGPARGRGLGRSAGRASRRLGSSATGWL
jgi:hypothetical protein